MIKVAVVALGLFSAWGCGLKGDLYLPDESEPPSTTEANLPESEATQDDAGDRDQDN